jgi:fucose 4-O-acetylase-like acetyltransferase
MSTTTQSATRLAFIDNVRIFVITLVIAHHAAQAYGPTGGAWPIANPVCSVLLGPFFPVNAAFFMGLLFLISGYFTAWSYERKGMGAFLKGRFTRIGIPLLVFTLCVLGPISYLLAGESRPFGEFIKVLYGMGWQLPYVHLWFLMHLLLYSLGYAFWRQVVKRDTSSTPAAFTVPNHFTILLFVMTLALVTWIVRIWFPIDRWVPLFFVIPAEPAHLPQYVSLFAIGTLAYRGDWLRRLSAATGFVWLWVGLTTSVACYVVYYSDALTGTHFLRTVMAMGGLNWPSLVWSGWEALICVGLCMGLLVFFREWFNKPQGKFLLAMAGASYGAYIIHLLVVMGAQAALHAVNLPPFLKFVVVTLVATAISFGAAHLVRQIPGVKKVL